MSALLTRTEREQAGGREAAARRAGGGTKASGVDLVGSHPDTPVTSATPSPVSSPDTTPVTTGTAAQPAEAGGSASPLLRQSPTVAKPSAEQPPKFILPNFDGMPAELKRLPNWVLWAAVWNGSKWTKRPVQVSGFGASSTNPKHWSSFDDVKQAYERVAAAGGYLELREKGKTQKVPLGGVGFVFGGQADGNGLVFAGVDFDKAVTPERKITSFAAEHVKRLGSYTEQSVSGTGLHVILKARALPSAVSHGGTELYTSGRFFTMTGCVGKLERPIVAAPDAFAALADELRGELAQSRGAPSRPATTTAITVPPGFATLPPHLQGQPATNELGVGIEDGKWFDGLPADKQSEIVKYAVDHIAKNSMLFELRKHGGAGYQEYLRLTIAIARSKVSNAEDIFVEAASKVKGADPEEELRKFFQQCVHSKQDVGKITIGTLIYQARQCGANFDKWKPAANNKEWPDGCNRHGIPLKGYANTLVAFDKLGMKFTYDVFRQKEFSSGHKIKELDGELSDAAVTMLRDQISEKHSFYPDKEMTREAITAECMRNRANPVTDYFERLKWDNTARLDKMLHKYLGAEDTPLNAAIGRKFMCAIVRRAKRPGCKYDHQVVLQSDQGFRKSMFCEDLAIFPDLFTDAGEFGGSIKEFMEVAQGKQIIEFAEMAGHNRSVREKSKSALSRRNDRARMAYAHYAKDQPRSSVPIGTTNPGGYLNDPTGERRYWHVAVKRYDRDAFLADKDQLYAEAVAREPKENLWLDTAALVQAHDAIVATAKEPNALVDELADFRGEVWEVGRDKTAGGWVIRREERVSNSDVRTKLGIMGTDVLRIRNLGKLISEAMMAIRWVKADGTLVCKRGGKPEGGYRRPLPDEYVAAPLNSPDAAAEGGADPGAGASAAPGTNGSGQASLDVPGSTPCPPRRALLTKPTEEELTAAKEFYANLDARLHASPDEAAPTP